MKRSLGFALGGALALATLGWGQGLLGQDQLKETSLSLVPKDADFYWASMRQSEQWDRFVNGPVAQKFLKLPAVTKSWKEFLRQWNDRAEPFTQARMVWDSPNFKETLAFFTELSSEETFVFADKNLTGLLKAVNLFSTEMQEAVAESQSDPDEAMMEFFDKWIDELKNLSIPTFVMGAKFKDEDAAITKVDQLEALIQLPLMATGQADQFRGLIKRVDDGRGSRISITLNGKLVPWDSLPTNDVFDEESMDHLREVLETKNLTLTIGTLDRYFVLAFTETAKDLLALGKGDSLISHPDLAPVIEYSGQPLTMVSYTSNVFAETSWDIQFNGFFSKLFSQAAPSFSMFIEEGSEVEDLLDDVESDLQWMDEEIAKVIPPFQGQTLLSFLTDDGWELRQYNRTPDILLETEGPLEGLSHVGGNPIMMVVTKYADHPEYFQLMRKIVQRAKARLDAALEMDLSDLDFEEDQQAIVKQMVARVYPILERLADIYEQSIAPSLTGEHGVVWTSGSLKAKQWVEGMPVSDEPLPLPEISWISGLKDRDMLIRAGGEVFEVLDSVVELVREMDPNAVPPGYSIPRPEKFSESSGVKFGYPIPEDCPVPADLMPHVLLTQDLLVAGYSKATSDSLAAKNSLAVGVPVLGTDARVVSASYADLGRLFASLGPWVRYAVKQADVDLDEELIPEDEFPIEGISLTPKDLLGLWEIMESLGEISTTAVSNGENGVVIRSVYRTQSLP